jgi:hypothetical protein
MKKQINKIVPIEQEYPELNTLAGIVDVIATMEINKLVAHTKTSCPYPAQCVLEMLIKRLEAKV